MIIHFPHGFNWKCRNCGACCRGWTLSIDEKSYHSLLETDFIRDFSELHHGRELFISDPDESMMLMASDDRGACIFQDRRGLCRVHRKLGPGAKPLGCRQFPFLLTHTPGGVYTGLSFHCPSVLQNKGRPVSDYREQVEALLGEYPGMGTENPSFRLDDTISMDWEGFLAAEEFIRHLTEHSMDLEVALWRGLITLCAAVLSLRQGNELHVEASALKREIEQAEPGTPARDTIFSQLALMYTLTVASVLESTSGQESRDNAEAMMYGKILRSLSFGKDIDLAGFTAYYGSNPVPWKKDVLGRYVEHLLFRKILLGGEPLLHNLAALYVAYNLCDYYLYLSAYQAGRPSPLLEDGHWAIDMVERGFVSHNRVMVPFFRAFAEGFMMQLQAIQTP